MTSRTSIAEAKPLPAYRVCRSAPDGPDRIAGTPTRSGRTSAMAACTAVSAGSDASGTAPSGTVEFEMLTMAPSGVMWMASIAPSTSTPPADSAKVTWTSGSSWLRYSRVFTRKRTSRASSPSSR